MKKKITAWILFAVVFSGTLGNICDLSVFAANQPISTADKGTSGQKWGGISDYRLDYINIDWWDNFNDELLKQYICETIENNHDLRIVTLKTKEFQELVKVTRAGEMPMVNFAPTYVRVKSPEVNLENIVRIKSGNEDIFVLPLLASYEADIFLKNHDKTKASKKNLEASKYAEKAAYISLSSAVATTYFNIIRLDKLIELQKDIVNIENKICELNKELNAQGLVSVFEVTLSDKSATQARILLNNLEKERDVLLNKFAVLLGRSPEEAGQLQRISLDDIEYEGIIPDSISSDVVFSRPDIMKVEAELEKAKIDIRIARKEFLPTIPISGIVGYASTSLRALFDWRSTLTILTASLNQTLFAGGRKIANLKIKKNRYEQLFETYRNTDLQAIQEINDALSMVKHDTQTDIDNIKKYALESANFGLSQARYDEGIISYLDLIRYKEVLLSVQHDRAVSKTARLVDYLSLYKATAGCLP